MMPVPVFHGHVENGKPILRPTDLDDYRFWLRTLEGKEFDLIVRKARKDRSNAQNRWYRGVIVPLLAQHLGYENDECHDALKQRFLSDHLDEELPRIRSTTSLSMEEFADYTEKCRRLAAELGVIIPDPHRMEP